MADLGCGPGILSIGAVLMGAGHVVGFDIDPDALEIAANNCTEMEIEDIDFVLCDVNDLAEKVST